VLGVWLRVRDARTMDDLGLCTVPSPLEPGDLAAFEFGPPLRIVALLEVPPGAPFVPVIVRPEPLALAAR
jgi:hypothetical protein